MKQLTGLIALLILLPNAAAAHSFVHCLAGGTLGPIDLKIVSEDSLLANRSVIRVIADGPMRDLDLFAQALRQPSLPDQVVLHLNSLKAGTTEIDEQGVEAVLTIKAVTLTETPLITEADGLGNLQIVKAPGRLRLRPNYSLTECRGIL